MKSYENINKEECSEAASYLISAFNFDGSPEGSTFWHAVHDRIYDLSRGRRPTDSILDQFGSEEALKAKNEAMKQLAEELHKATVRVIELERKLRIADFCNMGR